tara:strand:- start:518 stop:997 length:480 start_codon:yes stop_codon:yes gene_type:complete
MKVTDEMLKEAEQWNDFKANKFTSKQNSPEQQREFTVIGNLAEIAFSKKYPEAERISNKDYDADFIINKKRIDVKVKLGNYDFKDFYEVSVQAYQVNNNLDWYAFYHYNRKKRDLKFLGWITKEDFFKKAVFKEKGGTYNHNNIIIDNNVYELEAKELK